ASPEILRGELADRQSDLYAFGALLFEALTGSPVFSGNTAVDLAIAHIAAEPRALSALAPRGWVSEELDKLCLRLLQKSPEGRPRDARAVIDILHPAARAGAGKGVDKSITDEELNERINRLLADASDGQAALAVESAIG